MNRFIENILAFLSAVLITAGVIFISVGLTEYTHGYEVECKDIYTSVNYGNRKYLVTVYKEQCEYLKIHTKNLTELLDMLAIRAMECNRSNGDCYNYFDIGPFQINRIHKPIYQHSLYLIKQKRYKKLFIYQANYALGLVRYRMQKFCEWKRSKTNKRRFNCLYRTYNGCIKGYNYRAGLAWLKREKIKAILLSN